MISFKGSVKYLIYLFIAAWMFLLGIMVGRGSSPITFDTLKFQKRLETIANEFGDKKVAKKKIELKFYEVLDNPVAEEGSQSKEKFLEIIPKREVQERAISKRTINANTDTIPVKTSRKRLTFKQVENNEKPIIKSIIKVKSKSEVKVLKSAQIKKLQPVLKKSKSSEPLPEKLSKQIPVKKPGKYTIQIAAYKDFKDAVTHMSALEKKGFTAYRVKGEKDGVVWYRVRTGSFASYGEANLFKEKLDKAKIKSMILQIQ
jgi:cell division protein FtsN